MNFANNFLRKTSLVTIILFLLFSGGDLFGQKEKLIYDKITQKRSGEYYHMPVGLCEDYPEETTTMEIIRNDFEFLKKNGINLLRISFGWDAIEEEQGKYDWLFWDDYVKMAVDEYGITLVPYVCYIPQWNSTGAEDTLFFWNYPPKDYNAWGVFMKELVNRYKDRIHTWELWNEPDISIYWQGTRKDFAEFVKIGARGVREADPDAKTVLGGLAYDPYFLLHMFRDYGLSPYIDIVNIHNYYETWHRHPIEDITTYINEMHDVIWRYGDNQPLWMFEVGYSTFRKNARVSEVYDAYYVHEHSPEYQAVQLFKTLVLIASTENIEAVAWYELKDLTPQDEVIGDNDNNRHLGVAYSDWKPKPATTSLTFFNRLFSQPYKSIDHQLRTDAPVGSDVELHGFQLQDGSIILTAWLKNNVPGRSGDDRSGKVVDNRKETISVSLPFEHSGDVLLYDELGNEKKFATAANNGNNTEIKDIQLQGSKLTILKLNTAAR
jgi:hypothetical protein